MDTAQVVAVWLHAVSTVIVIGYYGILGRVVLPALRRAMEGPALGRAVVAIEQRAVPLVVLSVVVFTVSGAYLLLVDDDFVGLGRYFESAWATLMLIKHLLVAVMVAGGIGVHLLVAQTGDPAMDEVDRDRWLGYLRLAAEGMTALGAIILLLTAAAQVG